MTTIPLSIAALDLSRMKQKLLDLEEGAGLTAPSLREPLILVIVVS